MQNKFSEIFPSYQNLLDEDEDFDTAESVDFGDILNDLDKNSGGYDDPF
jgi:hypothetical protein